MSSRQFLTLNNTSFSENCWQHEPPSHHESNPVLLVKTFLHWQLSLHFQHILIALLHDNGPILSDSCICAIKILTSVFCQSDLSRDNEKIIILFTGVKEVFFTLEPFNMLKIENLKDFGTSNLFWFVADFDRL